MDEQSRRRAERTQLAVAIGKRLRKVRGDRSFRVFANQLGLDERIIGALANYENGVNTPGVPFLTRLAKREGVSLDWLLLNRRPPSS